MNQTAVRPGSYIVGVDEVGTGAWAGPFFVCAVAVPQNWQPPLQLKDSKKMSPASRDKVFDELLRDPSVLFCLQQVTAEQIDMYGQGPQLIVANQKAAIPLLHRVEKYDLVFDGVNCPMKEGRAVPKADSLFPAVSAASVLAKVCRDRLMEAYHEVYPRWGFAAHKGYGTQAHQAVIDSTGLCPIHRKSISRFSA